MANVNVMNMLKKRSTRRRQKRRPTLAQNPKRDELEDLITKVKADPIGVLASVEDGYFNELLQEYILTLPFGQKNVLRMFTILRNTLPMPLGRQFLTYYDETFEGVDTRRLLASFETFLRQPNHMAQIAASKRYISSRTINPSKMTFKEFREREAKEQAPDSGRALLPYRGGQLPQRNYFVAPLDRPDRAKLALFNRYLTAPWLAQFVDKPVIGIAMQESEPRYFTTNIVAFEDMDGQIWRKVNKLWLDLAINNRRSFLPNKVAYIFRDQSVIIEDQDMFQSSLAFSDFSAVENSIANESVSPLNFELVKNVLLDNNVIKYINPDPIRRAQYVQAIIQSTGPAKTNTELADKLGHVLLLLDPTITKDKRLFFRKLYTGVIRPSDIVNINYATAFVEWFASDLDLSDITNLLDAKQKTLMDAILRYLEIHQPTYRRRPNMATFVPNPSNVASFF